MCVFPYGSCKNKVSFLMAVGGGGGVKGLPFRKTELFLGLFLFVEKIPTAIKPGGGRKALMALPLRIFSLRLIL